MSGQFEPSTQLLLDMATSASRRARKYTRLGEDHLARHERQWAKKLRAEARARTTPTTRPTR